MSEVVTTSEKRATRTQEQRRQATIAALMNATTELLFDKGYAALTVSQIAERAKVSRGALTHYYATKEQLVIAAVHYAMDNEMQQIGFDAQQEMSLTETIDAFFDASEKFFLSRNFFAMVELAFAARNEPRVADEYYPLTDQYRTHFDNCWRDALVRNGMDQALAADLIGMTTYSFRGLALNLVRKPKGEGRQEIQEQFQMLRQRLHQLFNN